MVEPRAQQLRRHAVVFQLAQTMHVTPREAELELARREARARWHQTETRLRAKIRAHADPPAATAPLTPWWQKD